MPRIWIGVLVVLAAVGAAIGGWASAEDADGIRWEKDLDAANAKAVESGRPVMIVFR